MLIDGFKVWDPFYIVQLDAFKTWAPFAMLIDTLKAWTWHKSTLNLLICVVDTLGGRVSRDLAVLVTQSIRFYLSTVSLFYSAHIDE